MVHTRSQTPKLRPESSSEDDTPRIKEEECKEDVRSRELLRRTNHTVHKNRVEKVKEESNGDAEIRTDRLVRLSPPPAYPLPPPRRMNKITGKPLAVPYKLRYKPHQVYTLIDSIVNGKMSIKDASVKAGIRPNTGNKYYRKYLREGKMPGPYIGVCTKRKLFKKHTQYIVDLYQKDRSLTIEAVTNAVNAHFPNTDISTSALKQHIFAKIPDVYKTTATANGENSRKLHDYHNEFIVDLMKKRPDMSLKAISEALHEAYPGLCITATSVSRHIHTYYEDLYQESIAFQKNQRDTAFQNCSDFVKGMYEKNPRVTKEEVYEEVKKAFPDLNITANYLHEFLKKKLGQWYLNHLRAQMKVNRKILPEHTEFIRELYRKKPKLTLSQGVIEVAKKFPGFSVGATAFGKHVRKCGIEPWHGTKQK